MIRVIYDCEPKYIVLVEQPFIAMLSAEYNIQYADDGPRAVPLLTVCGEGV